jgi:hypothetical protein
MKFISPKIHGIIDFLVVLFLIASPMLFGLSGFVAIFTYALAIVHLILTLLTDFGAGLFKVIPLPLHGIIELIVGIGLIVLGFTLFKDTGTGKVFYIGFGAAVLLTWLFTNYKSTPYFQD